MNKGKDEAFAWADEPTSVPFYVLRQLPEGKFMGTETVTDMNGEKRMAIVWFFMGRYDGPRTGYFCIKNGDYLGDKL